MTEYSQFYDAAVPDWPGAIDFYRSLAREVAQQRDDLDRQHVAA